MAIIIAFIIIFIAVTISVSNGKKRRQFVEKQKNESNIAREKFDIELKNLESKYGICTKQINVVLGVVNRYKLRNQILVFEDSSIIVINEKEYDFSDIIGYNITDDKKEIISSQKSVTKTSTGNMIGRAVVGGVLLGGIGALAGAATAKKKTITNTQPSKIQHDYSINININSLSTPNVCIRLGANETGMKNAVNLLNVIIKRNENSKSINIQQM